MPRKAQGRWVPREAVPGQPGQCCGKVAQGAAAVGVRFAADAVWEGAGASQRCHGRHLQSEEELARHRGRGASWAFQEERAARAKARGEGGHGALWELPAVTMA